MGLNEEYDWPRIGVNVRRTRIVQGLSQKDLAERAGITAVTLYNLERGMPVRHRTLAKVRAVLGEPLESLRTRDQALLGEEDEHVLFRKETATWLPYGDGRTRVSEDDARRIQHPEERLRLGRLGFVPLFAYLTSFIMPEGPGLVTFELYGRYAGAFNSTIYRDCLIGVSEGRMRVRIGESTLEMEPGDVAGLHSRDLAWMEPAEESELPVCFTWTGAVRLGSPVREVGKGERVKRRKADA